MTKRITDTPIVPSSEVVQEFKMTDNVAELQARIAYLEGLLLEARKEVPKSHEEEIIMVELKRMWESHVVQNIPLFEQNDVKKLKILVEALNIIRNGIKDVKKKEKEMSVEDALKLVTAANDED
jgi:hypothetical protein